MKKGRVLCEVDLALRNTALEFHFGKKRKNEKSEACLSSAHVFHFHHIGILQQLIQKFTKLLKYFKNYYKPIRNKIT